MPSLFVQSAPVAFRRMGSRITHVPPGKRLPAPPAKRHVIYGPHAGSDFKCLRPDFERVFSRIPRSEPVTVVLENAGVRLGSVARQYREHWDRSWEVKLVDGTIEQDGTFRELFFHSLQEQNARARHTTLNVLLERYAEATKQLSPEILEMLARVQRDHPDAKPVDDKGPDLFMGELAKFLNEQQRAGLQINLEWEQPEWRSVIRGQRGASKRSKARDLFMDGYIDAARRLVLEGSVDEQEAMRLRDRKLFTMDLRQIHGQIVVVRGLGHMGGEKFWADAPVDVFCAAGLAVTSPLGQFRIRRCLGVSAPAHAQAPLSLGELSFELFMGAQNRDHETAKYGSLSNLLWSRLRTSEIARIPAGVGWQKDYIEELGPFSLRRALASHLGAHRDSIIAKTARELFGGSDKS